MQLKKKCFIIPHEWKDERWIGYTKLDRKNKGL